MGVLTSELEGRPPSSTVQYLYWMESAPAPEQCFSECSSASAEICNVSDFKRALSRQVRRCITSHVVDDSNVEPQGRAIYALSDPRDVREIRYVGQTTSPRRRFLQHMNTARLWLPDEIPWWVQSPKLRPLYTWLRELHKDDGRFPVMLVTHWVDTIAEARLAERLRIQECLSLGLPLLNFERELLDRRGQALLSLSVSNS